MTKTIELNVEEEAILAEAAKRRGVTPDDFLRVAWREMAEIEAAEDAEDLADARERLADQSEPNVSWEELKAEILSERAAA